MSKPLAERLTSAATDLFPGTPVADLLTEASADAAELAAIRKMLQGAMYNAFNPDLSTERNLHKHLTSSWS